MEVDGLSLNLETIFRHYEPSLGRWQSIDIATEEYFDHSPYNFALNDPIFLADPFGNDPWEDLINRLKNDPNSVDAGVYIRGDEGEVIHSEASTVLAEVSIEEARETDFLQSRIDGFYGQLYGGLGGPLADLFSMVENPDEDLIRSFQNPIANQIRGGRAVAAGVIAEVGLTLAPLPKIRLLGKLGSKVLKFFRSTKAGNVGARGSTSLAKAGTRFSKHSLERLAQRGVTPKMAETAINKGLKFYEPNEQMRKEASNYYGDERLIDEIKSAIIKLEKYKEASI